MKGVSITYAREITIFQTEVRKECYALLKLLIFVIDLITEKPDRTINYSIDRICTVLKKLSVDKFFRIIYMNQIAIFLRMMQCHYQINSPYM